MAHIELEYSNKELEKAFTDLSRMELSRKRLFANISHDLRTPLTLIQGYAEAIQDGVVSSKEYQHKYLKLIQNKIIGLTRLTDELFELSQLESRNKKFEFALINISTIITKLENKYRYDIENAGLLFKINAPENSDICINVDISQFERIFSNLIFNSIKYTREWEITVSCETSNDTVVFRISDTGCGISEQDLPYIFDRFYTPSKSRNSSMKSSGLGLAIAKEIVEYHGGKIWAESTLNQGSSFYFTIGIHKLD
ncbi:MAG: sensor histidine kinase [Acetivibrionales bacterium]